VVAECDPKGSGQISFAAFTGVITEKARHQQRARVYEGRVLTGARAAEGADEPGAGPCRVQGLRQEGHRFGTPLHASHTRCSCITARPGSQVASSELRHVLLHLGNRLTEGEVDAIFKEVRAACAQRIAAVANARVGANRLLLTLLARSTTRPS
jgi:hypothetical protein